MQQIHKIHLFLLDCCCLIVDESGQVKILRMPFSAIKQSLNQRLCLIQSGYFFACVDLPTIFTFELILTVVALEMNGLMIGLEGVAEV